MYSDPIADMLTRIRNANARNHKFVYLPASKMKEQIASILKKAGYIANYKVRFVVKKELVLQLKYVEGRKVINGLKKITKPGLRVYSKYEELPYVLSGYGIAIISTSQGIMTDQQARSKKVGGEVIAYVW